MALREPVSFNKGFWNPKNFYGLVQQKGPWDNQLIDDLKRQPHVLPEGPVGKGGTTHAGFNYWNLDTGFMDDMNTIDPGRLVKRSRPSLIPGGPFTGGGARLTKVFKKRKSFDRVYKDNLAEFLGLPDPFFKDAVEYIDTVYFDTKEPYNKIEPVIKSEMVGEMEKPPKEEIKVSRKPKRGYGLFTIDEEVFPGIEPVQPVVEQARYYEQDLNDIERQIIKEESQLLKTDLEKDEPIIVRNINNNQPVAIYKPTPGVHPANQLLRAGGNMLATGISYAPGVLQNVFSPVVGLLGSVGSTTGSLALEGGRQLGQIAGTAASDLGNVVYKKLPTTKEFGKLIGTGGNLLSSGTTYIAIKGFEAIPIINAGATAIAGFSTKMIKDSLKKIPELLQGVGEGRRGYSLDDIPKEHHSDFRRLIDYATGMHIAQYGLSNNAGLLRLISKLKYLALQSIKNNNKLDVNLLEDTRNQIAGPSGHNSMQIGGPAPLELPDANYVDGNPNRMAITDSFINANVENVERRSSRYATQTSVYNPGNFKEDALVKKNIKKAKKAKEQKEDPDYKP